jgi:ectoine hydroxylase-related dioxygenase (phytanoyl-CoA dioxygenase family)
MNSIPASAYCLPSPTGELAQGLRDIEEHGFAIVPDVLTGDTLKRAREALYNAADSDAHRERKKKSTGDYDDTNQRVWNVLSRAPVFEDLVVHPVALQYVRAILGWPALLGNLSANITHPGGGEMPLHADQQFLSEPWPPEPQGLNIAWCISDFTDANGGTRFVPGSHKLKRGVGPEDRTAETRAMEAPAGSIVVFESRLWHRTGFNRTQSEQRAAIFGWYTRPIYRTQENWFLSLKPEIRQFASDDMLVLLGFRTAVFGLVNGLSPA